MSPAESVAAITGRPVRAATPRGVIWLVELGDGRTVVAKRGESGQAMAEAAGLRWLRVPGGPPAPRVHGHDEHWLVTEHIPAGRTDGAAAERLGRELAVLHAAGAPAFGAPPPGGPQQGWIGAAPMANVTTSRWPQWYAEHRVLRYLRIAVDRGAVDAAGARAVHRACERIDELAGPAEPPARLHGDLWSGNVHAGADGRVWLLDPAAHGGHRETDLAMLALFGYPHLQRVLAGYADVAPLAPGWRARVPLHQLFPLLVHAVLFGGGYGTRAAAAARAAWG
ncbi:MAG: fructosamine kinase family protein [Pseudonocardiales bacterium]|nr:fructosamine kinase family protein [Pseudonocardiales bacterium]MBV9032579.1 fructosamine kinase family protein [Pseudonocardiales bacterium]MBW0009739.1 fructosamine kinase family protein [Pseudonocardiales bacterium]